MTAITETYLTVLHFYFSIYLFSYFDVVLKSKYYQFTVAGNEVILLCSTDKLLTTTYSCFVCDVNVTVTAKPGKFLCSVNTAKTRKKTSQERNF